MKVNYVEWDSIFFNKKIGLLELFNDRKSFEIENDFDLIYVISDSDVDIEITNYKQSYSENKIVFSKNIVPTSDSMDENVFIEFENSTREEIYELAFESGKFSRFKLDSNFKQTEFEKLYKKWVDNSFTKEFADAVLVYKEQNKILGFVTYKVWDNYATIGLIGVCSNHQGKGIGRKLITYVEIGLVKKGVIELRISTQIQNHVACEFYNRLGYDIIEKRNIKHFWKK